MKTELCWMLLPVTGLLSQIGGTWWKAARRLLIPLAMGLTYVLFAGWSWLLLPMVLLQWGAFSLPVTKFGNSIPGDKRNWLWLPLWGLLIASPSLVLNVSVWPAALTLGLFLAILVVLSNIRTTAHYFQWKAVELVEGLVPATVLCLAITL